MFRGPQDTGTGICMGKRGLQVITDGEDEAHISKGIYDAYTGTNLRYSQARFFAFLSKLGSSFSEIAARFRGVPDA
eukprot:806979-Rhodomonas_salina.1